MSVIKHSSNDELEIYFKYEYLNIETILKLFTHINQLHEIILRTTSPVYFNERTQERFRNIFDISELRTGESIKAKFSEKWKIELPFKLGSIEGTFPKKLGIPLIVLFFIIIAAQKSYNIYNSHLDSTLKQIEIELKRNELFQQMEQRRELDSTYNSAKRQARRLVEYVLENPDVTLFEVNDTRIKNTQ